jgi:hypothetical protein
MKNLLTFGLTLCLSIFTVVGFAKDGDSDLKKATINSITIKMTTQEKSVSLKWTAIDQKNIIGFVIEKSRDGINYNFVQNINAVNTEVLGQYSSMKIKVNNTSYLRVGVKMTNGEIAYLEPMLAEAL